MIILLISFILYTPAFASADILGNTKIKNFAAAKRLLFKIHGKRGKTIYCGCSYKKKKVTHLACGYKYNKYKKRSSRLEWEHIVPAHAFGQSFKEWRDGHKKCKSRKKTYKGRKCAKKVSKGFRLMEADLYNLYPSVGSINASRSNYSMSDGLSNKAKKFGGCDIKIENRKVQPAKNIKGNIARIYFYMNAAYPGRGVISNKNKKLFQAWDELDPVDAAECALASKIKSIQGNSNSFVEKRCQSN
jgi:deoxyribonuclease I